MATQPPPPPSAYAMTPPGSQSGRRISRFQEHPMQEYTPANSVFEEDLDYDEDHQDELTGSRLLLRLVGAVVHLALCAILLAIMGQFVRFAMKMGLMGSIVIPEAITLLVLVSLDIILDILSLVRYRRRWHSWALLLRLVYAIGYLAIFMVYVGLGRAFSGSFSYFGMPIGFSGPVVYLFLWIIGVWNLLHTALRRHHLGNGMRSYVAAVHSFSTSRRDGGRGNARPSAPQTRRSSRSTARIARGWGRTRRGAGADPEGRPRSRPSTLADSISLRERHEDEDDKTVSVTSTLSRGKTDEAGDTGPRSPPRAELRE